MIHAPNHSDMTREYYSRWVCVEPQMLDGTGTTTTVCAERDRVPAGYESPAPLFGIVRDSRALFAIGPDLDRRLPTVRGSLAALRSRGAAADLIRRRVDRILSGTDGLTLNWLVKFVFEGLPDTGPGRPVRPLGPSDYPLYRQFFAAVHPNVEPGDWLRPYFDQGTSRRLAWAAESEGAIVACTDAPSMPYLEARAVEVGINTHPGYRRQGYATAVCRAMIEEILRQGATPMWSCGIDNAASASLGRSVGFRQFAYAVGGTFDAAAG